MDFNVDRWSVRSFVKKVKDLLLADEALGVSSGRIIEDRFCTRLDSRSPEGAAEVFPTLLADSSTSVMIVAAGVWLESKN